MGGHIDEIDRRMKIIQLPKIIQRNLQVLSERQHYHANEWKYFLLFAAYPVFKGNLPEKYIISENQNNCFELTCLFF